MIKLLFRKEIDDALWNSCIEQSKLPSVTAYTWYLDIVSPNWSALILDEYLAVLPLPVKKKYGINYLLQPLFTKLLGVYAKQQPDEKTVCEFLEALPSHIKYVDININQTQPLLPSRFVQKKKHYQLLHLNHSYNQIANAYHDNVIRSIKKANALKLSLKEISNATDIIKIYQKQVGYKLQHIKTPHYKMLEAIINKAKELNKGMGLGVFDVNGQCIATAFFMHTQSNISFYLGSSTKQGRQSGAMTYLLDYVIKTYGERYAVFDFEGSSIKSIADFNKKLGAEDYVYLHVKKNTLPLIIRKLKK